VIDVLCIGHAAWDVVVSVPDFPAEDTKTEAIDLVESGGGPAANAAYLLSKWRVRCAFAGVVGDDSAGSRIAQEFQDIGADITGLVVRKDHSTPVSVIVVNEKTGSRTIVTHKAPTQPLSLVTLPILAPHVLLFDGHEPKAAFEAMDRFPNAKTVLDAGSNREGMAELASRVDYLVASERFACQIAGLSALNSQADRASAIAALHQVNGRPVVITLGQRGLVHGTASSFEQLPAFPARATDTTAAGDIFHGAFAYGILTGLPWLETLRLASVAAALSIELPGGRPSIPTLARVQEALAHAG
jgi:sugar/nucleoside kinase (ribokinase family)